MNNRGAILTALALVALLIGLLFFKGCSSAPVEDVETGRGYTVG